MSSPAPAVEISLDPIIYFYTHSLGLLAAEAMVFLGMGIWIGQLTWAKYKRRARAFQEECDLLRHEIASLKRRIGEDTTSTAPLVLINEDAPLPEAPSHEEELPGFDFLKSPPAQLPFAPSTPKPPKPEPQPALVHVPAPVRESLASVVIGNGDATHHTLEPAAPPDAITEIAAPATADSSESTPVPPPPVVEPALAMQEPAPAPETVPKAKTKHKPAPEPEPKPQLLEEMKPDPEPEPLDAATAFATELASGIAVVDPQYGILLHSQPDRWDDLTLLRGVGEVLQQRLHDNGVHTFKQIAYWTDQNVAAFSSKIEARDRIVRERWVTQARDMHFLKYGEKLG